LTAKYAKLRERRLGLLPAALRQNFSWVDTPFSTTEGTETTVGLGLLLQFLTANLTNLANLAWLANSLFKIHSSSAAPCVSPLHRDHAIASSTF